MVTLHPVQKYRGPSLVIPVTIQPIRDTVQQSGALLTSFSSTHRASAVLQVCSCLSFCYSFVDLPNSSMYFSLLFSMWLLWLPGTTFSSLSSESSNNPSCYAITDEECLICCERTVDSVLYTCGHMCVCSVCGGKLTEMSNPSCPMCRSPIRDIIKIYRSL